MKPASAEHHSQRRGSRSWSDPDGCDYVIKAILLGNLGVGKTSFLDAFMRGACPSSSSSSSSSHQNNKASRGRPCTGQTSGPKNVPCACNPERASLRSGKQRRVVCPCHLEGEGCGRGKGREKGRGGKQDSGRRTVMYGGKRVALTVWDTAGQERYRSMTASYYRGAHACIVMYDEHDEDSFDNVTMWLESVQEYRDTASAGIQTLLVGNVRSSHHHPSSYPYPNAHPSSYPNPNPNPNPQTNFSSNQVHRQRVQSLASHHAIPFFLVNSRDDPQSVQHVIDSLVTLVMTQAVGNQHLSQSITPYSAKLHQLAKKSRQSSCGRCCAIL